MKFLSALKLSTRLSKFLLFYLVFVITIFIFLSGVWYGKSFTLKKVSPQENLSSVNTNSSDTSLKDSLKKEKQLPSKKKDGSFYVYSDELFNISMPYPSHWDYNYWSEGWYYANTSTDPERGNVLVFHSTKGDKRYGIEVQILDSPENFSSAEWFTKDAERFALEESSPVGFDITADGVKTSIYSLAGEEVPLMEAVYIPYKGKIYAFRSFQHFKDYDVLQELQVTIRKMVESMRFIDNKANWKRYENKEKGYSIDWATGPFVEGYCGGDDLYLSLRINELIWSTDEKRSTDGGGSCSSDTPSILITSYQVKENVAPGDEGVPESWIIKEESILVGGRSGKKITTYIRNGDSKADCSDNSCRKESIVVLVDKDGMRYSFRLQNDWYETTFLEMLKTVRFTK